MHHSLTFLCFTALVAKGSGHAITAQLNRIKVMTNIAMNHINTIITMLQWDDMPAPARPTVPPIHGLRSVSAYLGDLEKDLQGSGLESLNQVQADVSVLGVHVRSLARDVGCLGQNQTTRDRLPPTEGFPDSYGKHCLVMVQRYMEELQLNMKKLKAC